MHEGLVTVFGGIDHIMNVNTDSLHVRVSTGYIEYSITVRDGKIIVELPEEHNFLSLIEKYMRERGREFITRFAKELDEELAKEILFGSILLREHLLRNRVLLPFVIDYMPAARSV
ncbi:MAG: hypothetical protein NZ888_05200 [Candidatus Nitrosocaldus sp.]|nr:hypothetical protein [Candidatus Nitrosocaldus sp.]